MRHPKRLAAAAAGTFCVLLLAARAQPAEGAPMPPALAGTAPARGMTGQDPGGIHPALEATATAEPAPTVRIGPLEFTRGHVRAMLGPREGRDRRDVARRLEIAAHAQGVTLDDEQILELVPLMVAVAEGGPAPNARLRPLRDALAPTGDRQ